MNPKDYIRASDGNGEAVRAVIVEDRDVGQTLINVDSVLNWPHKGIATSGDVDADGIMIEETISVFYFTLYGTMISIDEFAPGYYDQGNTTEQLVIIKPTTPWADIVADAAEQPSLPAGGTAGQILTKVSDTDGDAEWEDAPEVGGVNIVSKEVPTGTVNGTNKVFTTSQPYVAGSLLGYVRGLNQGFFVIETNPTLGQFEFDVAPPAGSNVFVSYQFAQGSTNEADVLDGFHASATPTANTIPVRNSKGDLDIVSENFASSVSFNFGPANTIFRRSAGVVYITYQGANRANASGDTLFTLPAGYRPLAQAMIPFVVNGNGYGYLTIYPDGVCSINTQSATSLSGRVVFAVSFPVQ